MLERLHQERNNTKKARERPARGAGRLAPVYVRTRARARQGAAEGQGAGACNAVGSDKIGGESRRAAAPPPPPPRRGRAAGVPCCRHAGPRGPQSTPRGDAAPPRRRRLRRGAEPRRRQRARRPQGRAQSLARARASPERRAQGAGTGPRRARRCQLVGRGRPAAGPARLLFWSRVFKCRGRGGAPRRPPRARPREAQRRARGARPKRAPRAGRRGGAARRAAVPWVATNITACIVSRVHNRVRNMVSD